MIKLDNILGDIIGYEFDQYVNGENSLKEIYCVLESPIRIGKINMDELDNTRKNYEYSLKAKQHGKLVDTYEGYEIYQFSPVNKPDDLYDVFMDNDLTYIYFNYIVDKNDFVWEKKIWQDHLNMGLFRTVMFNYYLKKFKGIVSDTILSPSGEKYWKKLLKQAKEIGYSVYVLKNEKDKIPLNDMDKYLSSVSYRFVIEK
jgi:hypothetical protein